MAKPLNPEVQRRLESYRRDYEGITGHPFSHFFCPILAVDEPIEEPAQLIMGHIINKAFEGASRAGSSNAVTSIISTAPTSRLTLKCSSTEVTSRRSKILADKNLGKKLGAKILLNDEPVSFTSHPSASGNKFVGVRLGDEPDAKVIKVKMNQEKFGEATNERWEIDVNKDLRIASVVSLIKAAHLTLFHLAGYKYALSAAGYHVGRGILGHFYRSNVGRTKEEILTESLKYFRKYGPMVRELRMVDHSYQGTVSDRKLLVCHTSSGGFWAQIVFLRTGRQLHIVMIPAFYSDDSVDTFDGFLSNDNERIQVSTVEFDRDGQRSTLYNDRKEIIWPKQGFRWPQTINERFFPSTVEAES